MEPVEGQIIRYVIEVDVDYKDPSGWVRFTGSHERMFLGTDCHLVKGDRVKITIEKVQPNADS